MFYLKEKLLPLVILFLFVFNSTYSQDLIVETINTNNYNLNVSQDHNEIDVSVFSFGENMYTFNFISHSINKFNYSLGYRIDDGLSYNYDYKTLKEVSFFDFNINYNLGAIDISLSVFNLFNFNNNEFDIEPVLDRTNNLEAIYFTHEPVFSVVTAIAYNF